ncbi:MAG: hypothetical protein KGH54_00215 [Candidatus Micrarchaeota archaeon]|nr:hypothetical protein [Candidatus Micrarchaeota archaeon]
MQINPDLKEVMEIGSLRRPDTQALLVAKKIANSEKETVYRIALNGKELFDLRATSWGGIEAIAINAPKESLTGYNLNYSIGSLKVNFEAPILEVRQINSDERGSISVVLYKGVEVYNMLATNTGFARGGHSHPDDVGFQMVEGIGVWYIRKNGVWKTVVQNKGDIVNVGADESHYVVALSPSLKSEIPKIRSADGKFKATNDDSREIVDHINKRQAYVNGGGSIIGF